MVNTSSLNTSLMLVRTYVGVTAATVLALVFLSVTAPHLATGHAWGHAIIVLVFAIVLPLRMRAAHRGRRSALRAVGIISGALLTVNVVESAPSRRFSDLDAGRDVLRRRVDGSKRAASGPDRARRRR
jgi:hypothetical protein